MTKKKYFKNCQRREFQEDVSGTVVGRIMVPSDIHALIPRTSDYVTGDCADLTKVKDLDKRLPCIIWVGLILSIICGSWAL